MQARHNNPGIYFDEQAQSCRNYYLPYVNNLSSVILDADCHVLEIGCGLGGSLSVFADAGCKVTGVDMEPRAIDLARGFFTEKGLDATFVCSDIFDYSEKNGGGVRFSYPS